jgi:hypothetical protein
VPGRGSRLPIGYSPAEGALDHLLPVGGA